MAKLNCGFELSNSGKVHEGPDQHQVIDQVRHRKTSPDITVSSIHPQLVFLSSPAAAAAAAAPAECESESGRTASNLQPEGAHQLDR